MNAVWFMGLIVLTTCVRSDAGVFAGGNQRKKQNRPSVTSLPNRMNSTSLAKGQGDRYSKILDELLANYDKQLRPNHSSTIPTIVMVNTEVRSMGPISDLNMAYQMDCYFRQWWTDPRLSFKDPNPDTQISLSVKFLERIWKPDTYFHNGKGSYIHMITQPNKLCRIDPSGTVTYSVRLTIKAKCPMKLRKFPLDQQNCPIELGSYSYPQEELRYLWKSQKIYLNMNRSLSQFDIVDIPCSNYTKFISNRNYSVLACKFRLKRHTGYFLIQVYLPCILLVILSWVSFWINREATSDRVGLGITTVLTLSQFSLDSRNDLPRVSYPTALDYFLVTCYMFVIATLLEYAGVHYFTKQGSGDTYDTDSYFDEEEDEPVVYEGTTFGVVENHRPNAEQFAADFAAAFSVMEPSSSETSLQHYQALQRLRVEQDLRKRLKQDNCCKKFLHCVLSNDNYRKLIAKTAQKTGVNSVSKIDRVSRILFPFLFGLFNAFYWRSLRSEGEFDIGVW